VIRFSRFTLDNGLKVIISKDSETPLANVNLLYNVGAKHENPDLTGFAHLFEHLMFSGTKNIPSYDEVVQLIGGENNAFTNNDFTNYYLSLPADNLETALWLEADRMQNLAINSNSLKVQQGVVIEEYKQVYLNQPYGDVWLLLRKLAYSTHPYQWPTIGKNIAHIEHAKLKDVKDFYHQHYHPANCILSLSGNLDISKSIHLVRNYFEGIPGRTDHKPLLPAEPEQSERRTLTVERIVPYDAIYIAFPMCTRNNPEYQSFDLLSDVLSSGKSSRFQQRLIMEKKLFSSVNAYLSGDIDAGLFIVTATLMKNVKMEDAEHAIWEELNLIANQLPSSRELQKNRNKIASAIHFSRLSSLNNAMNLAYFELIEQAEEINKEIEQYQKVKPEDLSRIAKKTFVQEKSNTLYYYSVNS
jgi:zinc protease